jgi:hypothetical protein
LPGAAHRPAIAPGGDRGATGREDPVGPGPRQLVPRWCPGPAAGGGAITPGLVGGPGNAGPVTQEPGPFPGHDQRHRWRPGVPAGSMVSGHAHGPSPDQGAAAIPAGLVAGEDRVPARWGWRETPVPDRDRSRPGRGPRLRIRVPPASCLRLTTDALVSIRAGQRQTRTSPRGRFVQLRRAPASSSRHARCLAETRCPRHESAIVLAAFEWDTPVFLAAVRCGALTARY